MARFVEVLLVLFFLAKFNATNAVCSGDQFQCKSSEKCIPINQRCDGISYHKYDGISYDEYDDGISYDEYDELSPGCEDGSDEDGCDFSSIIEVSKRIVCGYEKLVDGRWNLISYENSTECLDPYDDCWWDDDSSKCYKKFPAETGGLKCHSCTFRGLTRTDWTVECEKGDHYESCDITLADLPYDHAATDPKQACISGTWWTRCGTVDDCASDPKVSCCTTDYCNPLTIDNSDAQKILNDEEFIENNELIAYIADQGYEINFHKLLERSEENDTSAEDNGSVMKLDLVAACIVVITSAIMTV